MRNEKGFTLIELMIVVAIIGVLATIAVTQFNGYRVRGYNADAISVLKAASLTQEAYFVDHNTYATSKDTLIDEYNLEVGEVDLIIDPSQTDHDSYRMLTNCPPSPYTFETNGPGGTIDEQ
jgi:prepilin-type N-terminal cleavage/methylation domain-containing protein